MNMEEKRETGDILPPFNTKTLKWLFIIMLAVTMSLGATIGIIIGDTICEKRHNETTVVPFPGKPPEITNIHINPPGTGHPYGSWINISCDIHTEDGSLGTAILLLDTPNRIHSQRIHMTPLAGNTYYHNDTYWHKGNHTFTINATDTQGRWTRTEPTDNTFTIQPQEITNDTIPRLTLTGHPPHIAPGDSFTVDIAIDYNKPYLDAMELHIAQKGPIRLTGITYHDGALLDKECWMNMEMPLDETQEGTIIVMSKAGSCAELLHDYPINGTIVTLAYTANENISEDDSIVYIELMDSTKLARDTRILEYISYETGETRAEIHIQ